MTLATVLPVLWFGVIGFGVLMYVLLDGFVLGLGILAPFAEDEHQPGLVAVPDRRCGGHHVVELGFVLGEWRQDSQAQHEAVEQHVHQHAEADHPEPDHRQHQFQVHGAPSFFTASCWSPGTSSSPTDSGRAGVLSPPPCSGGVSSGCGPRRIIFSRYQMPAPKITA